MNPNVQPTTESGAAAPQRAPGGPHMNALKHGLRSAAVLLPGDDVAEFQALRRELFQTYQPCTRDEADCVESMAGYKWRIAHCQRTQAAFRAALDALVTGGPAGHICEPDPHRWQHRSMDCVLEEQRLHRLMTRDRATLFQLQHMRRNRLIDGAIAAVADYRVFLGEAEPAEAEEGPAAATSCPPETGGTGDAAELRPTPYSHGLNGEYHKGTPPPRLARVLRAPEVAANWMWTSARGASPEPLERGRG